LGFESLSNDRGWSPTPTFLLTYPVTDNPTNMIRSIGLAIIPKEFPIVTLVCSHPPFFLCTLYRLSPFPSPTEPPQKVTPIDGSFFPWKSSRLHAFGYRVGLFYRHGTPFPLLLFPLIPPSLLLFFCLRCFIGCSDEVLQYRRQKSIFLSICPAFRRSIPRAPSNDPKIPPDRPFSI